MATINAYSVQQHYSMNILSTTSSQAESSQSFGRDTTVIPEEDAQPTEQRRKHHYHDNEDINSKSNVSIPTHTEELEKEEENNNNNTDSKTQHDDQILETNDDPRYYYGPYAILLLMTMVASGMTFIASWSCQTFYGADVTTSTYSSRSSGGYGIWSLEDSHQQCQLWSVLWFAYRLDTPLRLARISSMLCMLSSLALLAVLTQVLADASFWGEYGYGEKRNNDGSNCRGSQAGRYGGWLVGIALVYWLLDSLMFWWRFNIWSTFFILTYVVMVLVVKIVLLRLRLRHAAAADNDNDNNDDNAEENNGSIHSHSQPDPNSTSTSTSTLSLSSSYQQMWNTVIRPLLLLCCITSIGMFSILASNVCRCDFLTEEDLLFDSKLQQQQQQQQQYEYSYENDTLVALNSTNADEITHQDDGNNDWSEKECTNQCILGPTSHTAIATPCLWFLVYCLFRWIQKYHYHRCRHHSHCRPNDTVETTGTQSTTVEVVDVEDVSSICEIVSLANDGHDEALSHKDSTRYHGHEADDDDNNDDDDDDKFSVQSNDKPPTKTKCQRRLCIALYTMVILLYSLVIVILLGSYVENRNAAMAPDTSYNFITDVVCAFAARENEDVTATATSSLSSLSSSHVFQTFASKDEAHLAGYQVAHCGACGECSNPADIETYVETRTTVAESAKKCSIQAVFGKDEQLFECLQHEIGFTESCTGCWADNMRTTAKYCLWTCLSTMLIGIAESNNVPDAQDYDWLNQCIYCDEKRSGPDFVQCSGVARRRLGIASEFERNPLEQCPHVDVDYYSFQSDKNNENNDTTSTSSHYGF